MKLPGSEHAIVKPAKITDYLLLEGHPVGRHKAKFFIGFGFDAGSWQQLDEALKRHAAENDVIQVKTTSFGLSYVVDGPLQTPSGSRPRICSVWFIEAGTEAAYFETAYPSEKAI